jgi:DNA-binding transcriptional ArsR family regulator
MTPFDVGQIDDVIHGRVRLGIMAYLAQKSEVAEFNKLKDLLQATQGNLSVHLRKLEGAGYVAIEKSAGRKAFGLYLDTIGRLVSDDGNNDGAFRASVGGRNP